jgi:hypothetical protein
MPLVVAVVYDENDPIVPRLDLACLDLTGATARQRVTNWIAGQGAPTLEQGLRLQDFLKKKRRSRA